MKKTTVRNLLVIFTSFAMVHTLASSASIGIATAKGSFRVDNSYVFGNATLFEGTDVETGVSAGELDLSQAKVLMATDTRGRVYQDRLILDRGMVQWNGGKYRTLAGEVVVVGVDSSSKAFVARRGDVVEVASLSGTVNVLSADGEPLIAVASGMAYDFSPEPQGATPGKKNDPPASAKSTKLSTKTKLLITTAVVGAGGGTAAFFATRSATNSR